MHTSKFVDYNDLDFANKANGIHLKIFYETKVDKMLSLQRGTRNGTRLRPLLALF